MRKLTHEEFIIKFSLLGHSSEYTILDKYINTKTHISVRHNCGHVYNVIPDKLLCNRKCPSCANLIRGLNHAYDLVSLKHIVESRTNFEYSVTDTVLYKNNKHDIEFIHIPCGTIFTMRPDNFLIYLSGCPNCKSSKGEKHIYSILTNLNINFEQQYRIPECRNKNPLSFDFVIFNEDGTLRCLIEYDGEQHFNNKNAWYSEYMVHNDNIKNEYCLDNNIKLIRIPYWEFENIEKILLKEINKHKIIEENNHE